jgi:transposase InsO family protein
VGRSVDADCVVNAGMAWCAAGAAPTAADGPLSRVTEPNALWCADFKGEFLLEDRRYCYPLTITDFTSPYLLGCEALESAREASAFPVFERVFQELGLPDAMRTANRVPFSSPWALYGLSKHCRYRGCGWGFASNGSRPAIPSTTTGMNACT